MSNRVGLASSLKKMAKSTWISGLFEELNAIFPEQRIIKATRFGVSDASDSC